MAWLLAGLALAPTGCNHAAAPNPAQPAAGGPVAVTVVHPEKRPIRRVVEQPGRVQAFEETELHVKLPGFVGAIAADPDKKDHPPHDRLIDIGSRVKAGQVLAELAVPELKAEAEQKEAAVRQTQAEVEQARRAQASAEAGISAADEAVKEATAGVARAAAEVERWDAEFTQTEKLVSDRVIDVQSREVVRKQRDSARAAKAESEARVGSASAAVRKAKAERDKAAADVTAATARVDVAKADAKRVAALLDYTHITAPYDGVVTRRRVNTGDFLQPGTGKAEGVFVVARTDPVRVVIDVPEADAGLVKEGAEVKLTVQAVGGPPLSGRVSRTSWSLEPGARTLRAEVDLPNPDGRLRPGMYVFAHVTAELPAEAWAVPSAAVVKHGDGFACFVAEGGKAVRVPVRVGRGDGSFTQVLEKQPPGSAKWEPFAGTEPVIATEAGSLTDGQPVEPKPAGK